MTQTAPTCATVMAIVNNQLGNSNQPPTIPVELVPSTSGVDMKLVLAPTDDNKHIAMTFVEAGSVQQVQCPLNSDKIEQLIDRGRRRLTVHLTGTTPPFLTVCIGVRVDPAKNVFETTRLLFQKPCKMICANQAT